MNENTPDWKNRFQEAFTPYSTDEVIREAITEKNRNIPEKLFRFRSFNENHKNYTEDEMSGKLCFQPRSNLNDPYDGTIMQKHKDPLTYFREHSYLRKEILESTVDIIYPKEAHNALVSSILSNQSDFTPNIPNVSNDEYQRILSITIQNTSDYIKQCNDSFKTNLDRFSQIVCFSEDLTNLLMWAHYSSNHEGYCFEYRFNQLDCSDRLTQLIKDWLVPVCYVDTLYDFTDISLSMADKYNNFDTYPCSSNNFFRTIVVNKLRDWSYEREWRMIMGIGELTEIFKTPVSYTKHPVFAQSALVDLMSTPHPIPILKPNAIYLGVKVKPDVRDFLISTAVQNNISVYQMELTLTGLQASLVHDCNH